MQAFRYQTPASVADARAAAAAGAKLMAGGQSLLPSMRLGMSQPEVLADLSCLPGMAGITVSGGVVRVGAMTT
ncbi:MAG: FAD binding domain-containing protein, partial [Betaproteobacteria bacterium]